MKTAITSMALILLLVVPAFSQQNPPLDKKDALNAQPEKQEAALVTLRMENNKKETVSAQVKAHSHIKNLKQGVLLVRLRTSENAIKSLEKAGNLQMATTLKRRQEAENKRLISAFKQNFTFCPVYFFYSSASEKIKGGNFNNTFVDENLAPIATPEISERNFHVAEITDLEQNWRATADSSASNSGEVSFKALVIRDNNFHQLKKPFPFFIKASQNIPPRKRSEPEMVTLLNAKLTSFHKTALKKAK